MRANAMIRIRESDLSRFSLLSTMKSCTIVVVVGVLTSFFSSALSLRPLCNKPTTSTIRRTHGNRNHPHPRYAAPTFPSKRFLAAATTRASSSSDDPWTKPRLHNAAAFRSAAILMALFGAGYAAPNPLLTPTLSAILHVTAFATWYVIE